MSEMKSAHGILDTIQSISSNRESGELEISSSGSRGTLLFNEGRLVDAKLGTLTGFQAVNAAVSLRDVQLSFNPLISPPRSGPITQNERIVLKQFFGIETVEMGEAANQAEPEIDWNLTPHQVVPLAEVEELDESDLQDTPTLEVRPVISSAREQAVAETAFFRNEIPGESSVQSEPQSIAGEAPPVMQTRRKARPLQIISAQGFEFLLRPSIAVCLMLLVILAAGAIALMPKLKAHRQSASVASTVATQPSSVPELSTAEVNKESLPESKHQAEQVANKSLLTTVAQQQSPRAKSGGSSLSVTTVQRDESRQRDINVQDLTGEWKVTNTVQKTAYKSFDNMEIGFRLIFEQTGKDFTARGEKVSENGRNLPAGSRTPIRVTGSIDGDEVVANFVEDGAMRKTNGRFVWRLQPENAALTGTFVSAAANSSGKSAATRKP